MCYTLVAGEGGRPPRLDQVSEEVLRHLPWRYGTVAQVKRDIQDIKLSLRLCSPRSLWLHEIIGNALVQRPGAFVPAPAWSFQSVWSARVWC